MSARFLLRGVRPLGGDPRDVLRRRRRARRDRHRPRRGRCARSSTPTGWSRCPASSTCTPTCASPAARTPRPSRPARRAAALGGFTAVHAMANTDPVADTAGVVEQVWRLGRRGRPLSTSARRRGHRRARRGAAGRARRDGRLRGRGCGSSPTTASACADAVLMRRALEYVKAFDGVVAQHAQEPRLTEGAQMNEGEVSGVLGLTGWPAVAEEAVIARDVPARRARRRTAARLPRLDAGFGRDRALGQEPGRATSPPR